MPLLNPRRALTAGLTLAALAALPAAGSAKQHVYPDGPNCTANAGFQSPKSITDAVKKGVPFTFDCGFYKDNSPVDYFDPATKSSDFLKMTSPEAYAPKLEVKGTITLSAKAARFLHLSSRVIASGDLTGPVTVTKDDEDTDVYRLHLKPSITKLLIAQHAGSLVTDYDLTLKVLPGDAVQPGPPATSTNGGEEGGIDAPPTAKHVTAPGGTMKFSNDPDEPVQIIENASAPCKHFLSGDGSAFGCAGGVGI